MLKGQKYHRLLFSFLIITLRISNLALSTHSIYIICTKCVPIWQNLLETISRPSFRVLKLFRNVEIVLTILTWKSCCTQFSSRINWNRDLKPLTFFMRFTQSIEFCTFHFHTSKAKNVWKRWFIKQRENQRLLLSVTLTTKCVLVFVLKQENTFPREGDQMVISSFASSNNTFTCNTAFVSTSSWEDIKQSMRVKLEFSIFTTLASRDRRNASVFVFAREWVTFCSKNSKINSNECYLFSLFIECVHKSYHHILTSDFLFIS